jgi:hypothetical protein
MTVTNALAYYTVEFISEIKKFYVIRTRGLNNYHAKDSSVMKIFKEILLTGSQPKEIYTRKFRVP